MIERRRTYYKQLFGTGIQQKNRREFSGNKAGDLANEIRQLGPKQRVNNDRRSRRSNEVGNDYTCSGFILGLIVLRIETQLLRMSR